MQPERSPFSGKIITVAICLVILFCSSSFGEDVETSDPIRDGGGARPLGIGRATTASLNDVNALFYNPAGLAAIKTPQAIATYYSKVFGSYDYTVAGGAMPTQWGVLGVGYVGEGVGDVPVTTQQGTQESTLTYADQLFFASYADSLERFFPAIQNVYIGANLKMFLKGTSGALDYNARGYNCDIGLKYMPYNWLAFGFNKQNVIGGNIVWNTGLNETYPSPAFIGTTFKDLAHGGSYSFDVEYPSAITSPTLYHAGFEMPVKYDNAETGLTIRLGADQAPDATGDRVIWNYCAGLGMKAGAFTIDYSYHPYYSDESYGSHYVSLSYSVDYENNIKAHASAAVKRKKYTEGDIINIEVDVPYAESYVAAVTPDGTEIPLKNTSKGKWTGTWTIPHGKIGRIAFTIKLLDMEGYEDPVMTNDIDIVTPEEASQEAAQEIKDEQEAAAETAKDAIWHRVQADIASTRSYDQYVKYGDVAAIAVAEKHFSVPSTEANDSIVTVSGLGRTMAASVKNKERRMLILNYISSIEASKQVTFRDLVDIVYSTGYFEEEAVVAANVGTIEAAVPEAVTTEVAVPTVEAGQLISTAGYDVQAKESYDIIEQYLGVRKYPMYIVRRQDLAVIIAKRCSFEVHEVERSSYRDIDPASSEAKYIQACYDNHVAIGYPDGTFRPRKQLTSFEMLAMMSNSIKDYDKKQLFRDYARFKDEHKRVHYMDLIDASVTMKYLVTQ